MWKQIPKNLKVLQPRINRNGQLVVGISPQDAGKSYKELLKISAGYDDYRNFLTEECLRFETFAGTPVLQSFSIENHCKTYLGVIKDAPLVLLFDPAGTHPGYAIWQHVAGRTIVHGSYAPRRKPGFEVDLDSICLRMLSEFRDPTNKYYNKNGWDFVVISDHIAHYENNQGVPGKAAEILEKHFGVTINSYHMSKAVYDDSFRIVQSVVASNGLFTVNPNCQLSIDTYKSGWHYPERMDEQADPKPEPIHPYIDIGDLTRYGLYHFYRYEAPSKYDLSELNNPDCDLLSLDASHKKGFNFGL